MTARRGTRSGTVPALVLVLVLSLLTIISSIGGCSCSQKPEVARKPAGKPAPKVVTCPLCGLPVQDRAVLERRPVAVKVGNDPSSRPQSGLDKACVVYEEVTEGGVTRFMAVYLCRDADPVGPVRSARPADIEIIFPCYALFAHCGGGKPTLEMIKQAGLLDIDEMAWTGAYWRSTDRRAPHNLYTSTTRIRQAGEVSYPFQQASASPFEFLTAAQVNRMAREREEARESAARQAQSSAPAGAQPAPAIAVVDNIVVPYDRDCVVSYAYDHAARNFLRYVAGVPQADLTTGAQLRADTVVLQYVTEGSSGIKDVRGAESPDLGVIGSGRAQVFVMGRVIDANWVKSSRAEHTRFLDNAGDPVPVKPGSIWIELVPSSRQATVS